MQSNHDGNGAPLLEIVSNGRRASVIRHLSSTQVEQVRRTVSRVPEVMIKVTGGSGATSSKGVAAHFSYIGRRGEVEIETDDGETLSDTDTGRALVEAWDLDIDNHRRRSELFATNPRKPPKLVHRLVFSMPAGTSPTRLLAAVRDFARDEFAPKYRYAMALHTDEPHPHVHLVLKAMSEQGARLNIRKETLRRWRLQFARCLRNRGVAANATPRAVRGHPNIQKSDGIYRAALRGESTHMRGRVSAAALLFANPGGEDISQGRAKLIKTRADILEGWKAVAQQLAAQGEHALAAEVHLLMNAFPPVKTERQVLADQLRRQMQSSQGRVDLNLTT